MDPLNNASSLTSSHVFTSASQRSTPSIPHQIPNTNPNIHHATSSGQQHQHLLPLPPASSSLSSSNSNAPLSSAGGGGRNVASNYSTSYVPQGAANNTQFHNVATANSTQQQQQGGGYGQPRRGVGMPQQMMQANHHHQQHPAQPPSFAPPYDHRSSAAGVRSPPAAASAAVGVGYSVPNPLGNGGGQAPPSSSSTSGIEAGIAPPTQAQTELLRSMYHSRQQHQPSSSQQQQGQGQGGGGQGVQIMQPSYRTPSSSSMPSQPQQRPGNTYVNVQHPQQQQQQQQRSSAPLYGSQGNPMTTSTHHYSTHPQGVQANYPPQPAPPSHTQSIPLQQRQLPSTSMHLHHHPQQQQQQQQPQQHHQRQQQQPPPQPHQQTREVPQQHQQYHAYDRQSQHVQPVQGMPSSHAHHHQQQQPQQQQPQQQQQQQQPSRALPPSQQFSTEQQASTSSSQHQQQQQQQQVKQRFHLTPEAKAALREAVLSAIRHPSGTIDPGCLQRAIAQGLPEKAILNAAVVARERDRRNREERARNVAVAAAGQVAVGQQKQQQVTTEMGGQGQQQGQESHKSQQQSQMGSHPSKPKQGTVVHHPGMPRASQPSYAPQQPPGANTAPTSLAKPPQMMQPNFQTQPSNNINMYYSQVPAASDQTNRMYHQQQQQPHSTLQQNQKLSDEEMTYQRQYHAQKQQQAAAAAAEQQRRSLEDSRRHQLEQSYQKEQQQQQKNQQEQQKQQKQQQQQKQQKQQQQQQQRRLIEDQRKQKEAESAQRSAREAAQRNEELANRMKKWGRIGFGLVVKDNARGLSRQQQSQNGQQTTTTTATMLRQSMWGGASMCSDDEPALVSALRRAREGGDKKDGLPFKSHSENVQLVVNSIRKQLLLQEPASCPTVLTLPPSKIELRRKRTRAMSLKLMDAQRTHTHLKRIKIQPKRESKFLDKHIRRARQLTADAHSKRHKELLKAIMTHQTEFYKYHRWKKNECAKIARSIRDSLRKAEVAKEKEAESAEKARLAALRANDMAAYTSLLEDTKNERLKFLLDKTDECMNQISNLLASRVAEEEEDIKNMGGEGTIKATFTQDVTGGSYYETAHVKSEQVRQPSLLVGGELKEYQLSGLQWLVSLYNNRLNGILADEMGLGKTIQTISLIAYLIEAKQILGPYLVIVPLSTLSNWVNEFAKWLPAAVVVCYKGTPQQRKQLYRDEVADGHFNVLLTTYEFVIRDKGNLKKIAWQYAIVDEGHRMKNNQSKFAVTLGTQYHTRRRVLLTGTPLQNNLPELWALLNFLLPAIFNSAETFDQWFNKPFSSFGKTSTVENGDESSNELLSNEERMLIIHRLHELLRPFMLRRIKSEVLDQLPEKVEKVLRCELSSWQKELYKQISHKIAGEAATKNFNRGLNNVVMQLRKVCNHPLLFSQDGYHINDDIIRASGKVELLDRMLPKLKAAGHRVLMFTQMTKMMPILEDYFAYRGFTSLRLDGSTTADEREKRMYMFNAPDSPYFIFLLSTRAGGLGLNLATADTVIIFDSDWNPMMDLQAQDRAHRIGQRKDVRVFRIITQSPVEEKILSRATEKLQMNELVVEAGKFDKSGQDKDDNSLERLKMMELLLHDFDQNQNAQNNATSEEDFEKASDDGEEEDSKDLLNEMISSNDDDYKLYCEMDRDRTDAPVLYTEVSDCPDWILYPNGKPEPGSELIDAEYFGKRRAAAGEKVYDDGLTEKQFCRMMDKHADEDEKGKKKRKKKRNRNAVDPSLILDYDGGGGRKRSKTTPLQLEDTPRSKASSLSSGGSGNGEITAAMYDRLLSITRSIIYLKEKGTKRRLSDIFLEKPCPQTYPDYYQLIEKPIGMNDILRKCRAKLYSSVKEFREDWNTLFKNARTYNGEGSWIVNDAEVIRGELDRLMEKNDLNNVVAVKVLNANTTAPIKKPVRIKLSLKIPKKKKDTDGVSGTSTPAHMKMSESQSELSNRYESEEDSESSDSDTYGSDND